ncbi:MAG: anti-sigma factor [Cephaloticoccus sp.]
MSADQPEEFAALHALGLLEGDEQRAFADARATDAALDQLAEELEESAAQLAFLAPSIAPPAALKARLEAQLRPHSAPSAPTRLIPWPWLGWAAAASFAFLFAAAGLKVRTLQTENDLLRQGQALSDAALRSVQNQAEAEAILAQHELHDSKREVAELNLALQQQGDLARFKIAALTSLLGNSPEAIAVAVWNPDQQEGLLTVDHLPALAEDRDYQLWVIDPQYPIPVDGGVFRVDPATGRARYSFKADKPIKTVAKFAVSLERRGGVPKAEGPMVLLSQ